MDELSNDIRGARKTLLTLVQIARWLWVANTLVLTIAIIYSRIEVAVLAGFTLVLSLLIAATAKRASGYLRSAVRALRTSSM